MLALNSLLLLPTLLLGATAAPIPDDTITAFNNAIRCRDAPTHSGRPVRLYNAGDAIVLTCQTGSGWWLTRDGCYVDSRALHPLQQVQGGVGHGARDVVERRICPS